MTWFGELAAILIVVFGVPGFAFSGRMHAYNNTFKYIVILIETYRPIRRHMSWLPDWIILASDSDCSSGFGTVDNISCAI